MTDIGDFFVTHTTDMALSLKAHGFNVIVETLLDRNQAADTSTNNSSSQRHIEEEVEIVVSGGGT